MRITRVLPDLAERTPLPQQIPALIELDLDFRQMPALGGALRTPFEQPVLFGNEALDLGQHAVVRFRFFHENPLSDFQGASCARNSPPGLAALCTFTYKLPALRLSNCASVNFAPAATVNVLSPDLVSGTITGPFFPFGAS